jgi:enoyl-[acyl-carrier protein] reductase / trans-2-enoyl-CoA reductase (NAD+)
MPLEVIERRSRGFICVNAHPEGCRQNVLRQIDVVAGRGGSLPEGPRSALVIGGTTGYGLASRIALAFGSGARTVAIGLERAPAGNKTATAGYYNTAAFHEQTRRAGLEAHSLNADTFAEETKREAIALLRGEFAPVEMVVYSLAAPKRIDPETGAVHHSALKPIGAAYASKTIDLDGEKIVPVTLPPAEEKEIADTVAVMGGNDWRRWIVALMEEGLLAPGARTVAYSYLGPRLTWPIYRDGTIGRAKKDLEETAKGLDRLLGERLGGHAWISMNKAVVTQAAAAIPVVPLYMSLLGRVMKRKGIDEGPIEQMSRLFLDFFAAGKNASVDEGGRVRLDDREMRPDVQAEVERLWPEVTTENLFELTDFAGFKRDFRNLFGFEVEGVDYSLPVETAAKW